ncbi:protein FAR1-RELATED SEQUENCE 3-like [Andrographis paniculata]|uniref:protein FAR1-RELATED SEQUENCE 3-like n=1 Tax=Andrographis paniculata TaxID=175694 RepID=UPI0021E92359|nr:protein FAR1-RELATED SEQUENCE 3-like [Andrographis paniculata]XP_051134855.1 protein FAR1-RELATED SEQUENCE 3-like [Andrographis paniculata]XP_051134924.1 protein FAR1-RELATED SEQUENCE 3-like [Andrographis paniculata]XP_051135000.1 protein FAR1-RELATED SEQUENCE 3-like [Andrographis paniculata]XP_051135076.1 protein FAR1-RELATED SEQUENCE 3-like [Andrographis paniculata]XP_051135161.1 protein FAR1-RELATED SEQUENCE 3-like [Andrographis paniculata]XP_051135242.1 protein FAR1-RELATED SEQUENCE 3-
MDTEVIKVEIEKRQRDGVSCTQRSEDGNENQSGNPVEGENNQADDGNEKPYVGMEFESEESAKKFYDAYGRRVGFSIHAGQYSRTNPDGPIVSWEFACSREVFKRKNIESCSAMLHIERKDPDRWVVTKFVEDHNHSIMNPSKVHYLRTRRHFAGATKSAQQIVDNQNDIMVSVEGNNVLYDPNPLVGNTSLKEANCTLRNVSPAEKIPVVRNLSSAEANRATVNTAPVMPLHFLQPSSRRGSLGKDAQNLLTYFQKMQAENPGFFYAIQLGDDNHINNVFWADARSRIAYSHFGDAVTFDTMYRPNQFQVPFAPFTGVNNHGQMVLFGCALLFDESEASFTWVFTTWLSAMNNRPPVSITTDQDRAIKAAVHRVLPETRHCICKWHILREGHERLSHIYNVHSTLYGELYGCINFSETIEDFESSWRSINDKYDLWKNEWLQAVYNARRQWAPVYFRDTFFAALSSNYGVCSFLDGYVNQQTTLPMFFKQYERALEKSVEREVDADYDTLSTTPVLKTPSPMEQQAANLYTKKVFMKFQEELVETFVYTANKIDGSGSANKFRVAKYEHDHKAYIVTLDFSEMNARCSCQMFEYSGVLCRHILTVFTVTNVLTIPSHYILKRWTRNARGGLPDEQEMHMASVESLIVRFNSLCWEAIKFADEGAISNETYQVAMETLRDGARKISMVKKNVATIKPSSSQGSGSFPDQSSKKASLSFPDTAPSLWPCQEAASNCFNLNDAGNPVSDSSHPTMAPIAINRDGSLADNTVVLTCFKSMTWVIENKNWPSEVAVINLKLQDYGKTPSGESEVQFRVTRATLEPMLKSMAYISQQLSIPANRVAVINLKLQDPKTTSGEAEVKFQVSRDTLGSMLRSMAYIREQL